MSGTGGLHLAPGGPWPGGRPATAPRTGRLRVALALPPWFSVPPRAYGGIETLVAGLADALIERGHDVVMVAAGRNGTRARLLRTYEVPPSERLGESLPEVLQAAWISHYLDHLDVDLVHDHSLAGPLTAKGRPVPTVVTAHGPCSGEMADYYRHLSSVTHLVAISHAQRRLAADVRWAGTVHNGLRVADFPFRARKDDYVLFLGRFSPDKGAHLAIEAARRAGRPIVLAGKMLEPVERAYFDAEVRPRLGAGAEFVGEADMRAKRLLYAAAHCMVFPITWDEPFGMVMIEAMACGTPVVALRRGSVPEIVVDGVTGCVRDHPAELPAAIDAAGALSPVACRRHAERRFDVAVMAAGYERVYAGLTGARATATATRLGEAAPTGRPAR
ncbi:glycosyltransferase family 4 protein [Actinomadura scrupuli]|uniref:glycosyltransferase family 4 protein n=1 Tax=Actinomadura scrupuli TaxID=559629 RepID=UPI003D999D84